MWQTQNQFALKMMIIGVPLVFILGFCGDNPSDESLNSILDHSHWPRWIPNCVAFTSPFRHLFGSNVRNKACPALVAWSEIMCLRNHFAGGRWKWTWTIRNFIMNSFIGRIRCTAHLVQWTRKLCRKMRSFVCNVRVCPSFKTYLHWCLGLAVATGRVTLQNSPQRNST